MKKIQLLALIGAFTVLAAKPAFSADTVDVQVIMTVQEVGVAIDNPGVFGILNATTGPGSSVLTSPERTAIKNTGNLNEDFGVKVASPATGPGANWPPFVDTSTTVPKDHFRLFAIWAVFNSKDLGLSTTHFNLNDIVTTATQWSDTTKFWSDGSSDSTSGVAQVVLDNARTGGINTTQAAAGGDDVSPNVDPLSLFFRFDAGASGTSGGAHTAIITITARIH